ncbi:hypothetical protein HU200_004406 [Digitaria exilis]|uniref:Uncharacterized protein n=1 Tax=Digitaria exilis TaxID=1010633 RepID=A0A835FVY0_9POAL|nr:hypothetical protein HU200_004406 [Digitaria exilis]
MHHMPQLLEKNQKRKVKLATLMQLQSSLT